MPIIKWKDGNETPQADERLLFIREERDVEVGVWDGDFFRLKHSNMPVRAGLVSHWAYLEPCLPKDRRRRKASPRL